MTEPIGGVVRLVPGLIEKLDRGKASESVTDTPGGESFGDMLSEFVGGVNKLHHESADIQEAFLRGEPVELHQVMVKAEEAGVATELLIEIRNKVLEGYNELLRMPV